MKFEAHATESRRQTGPKSPALLFEFKLKEKFDSSHYSPSSDRAQCCFQVFEDVLAYLGPFAPVMKNIRDELYRSVYSKDVTSAQSEPFVKRIPYFQIAGRIEEEKSVVIDQLQDTILEAHQKTRLKEDEITLLHRRNLMFREELSEQEKQLIEYKSQNHQMSSVLKGLQVEKNVALDSIHEEMASLKHEVESLTTSLTNANLLVQKLSVFETSYDERALQEKEAIAKTKQDFLVDPEGLIHYDLHLAGQMESQFSDILNLLTEDYEASLLQLKKKRKLLNDALGVDNSQREEAYIKELNDVVISYKHRVVELLEEQKLLQRHTKGLNIALKRHEADNVRTTMLRTADMAVRKYAVTALYSDDQGVSFKGFKYVQYCQKCGDKTLVCPHRHLPTTIVNIPEGITHLKFSQPELRLKSNIPKETEELSDREQRKRMPRKDEPFDIDEDDGEDEQFEFGLDTPRTFRFILRDYYRNRGGKKPKHVRTIPLDRCMVVIQEMYEYRFKYEEDMQNVGEEDSCVRFLESFYEFLTRRYQNKEVASKVAYDLLASVWPLENGNARIRIFLRTLSGEEDCTWKYIFLANKLWEKFAPMDPVKYRQALGVIYPSRTRETLEQVELEYLAFSKSKYSTEALEDHLIHTLRSQSEPNFKFFFKALKKSDRNNTNAMTFEEFDAVFGSFMPGVSSKLKLARFRMLARLFNNQLALPIERLAELATYCSLHVCFYNNWVPQAIISESNFGEANNTTQIDHRDDIREQEKVQQQEFNEFLSEAKAHMAHTANVSGLETQTSAEGGISDRDSFVVARAVDQQRYGNTRSPLRERASREPFDLELDELPQIQFIPKLGNK